MFKRTVAIFALSVSGCSPEPVSGSELGTGDTGIVYDSSVPDDDSTDDGSGGPDEAPDDPDEVPDDVPPHVGDCDLDDFEPSDELDSRSTLPWYYRHNFGRNQISRARAHAALCADDSDWYAVNIEELNYWNKHRKWLSLDVIAEGSSWCGDSGACGGGTLEPGDENAVAIGIYEFPTMFSLGLYVSKNGRIDIDNLFIPDYTEHLVFHVYSPTNAVLNYGLHIDVRNHEDPSPGCDC